MKNVNSDVAYKFIRKRIISGEYPPGLALKTDSLAKKIGVSRTPVRDALRQLEADNLVIIRAHLGASVRTMDFREFREMCGLRLALESYAAGLAAENHSRADLQEMRSSLESMRKVTDQIIATGHEETLLDQLIHEDIRFHIAVLTAAKNDLIKSEILRLHVINRIVSRNPLTDMNRSGAITQEERQQRQLAVFAEHEEIYRAISECKTMAAKTAMEKHIQEIVDHSMRAITRSIQTGKNLSEEELSYTT